MQFFSILLILSLKSAISSAWLSSFCSILELISSQDSKYSLFSASKKDISIKLINKNDNVRIKFMKTKTCHIQLSLLPHSFSSLLTTLLFIIYFLTNLKVKRLNNRSQNVSAQVLLSPFKFSVQLLGFRMLSIFQFKKPFVFIMKALNKALTDIELQAEGRCTYESTVVSLSYEEPQKTIIRFTGVWIHDYCSKIMRIVSSANYLKVSTSERGKFSPLKFKFGSELQIKAKKTFAPAQQILMLENIERFLCNTKDFHTEIRQILLLKDFQGLGFKVQQIDMISFTFSREYELVGSNLNLFIRYSYCQFQESFSFEGNGGQKFCFVLQQSSQMPSDADFYNSQLTIREIEVFSEWGIFLRNLATRFQQLYQSQLLLQGQIKLTPSSDAYLQFYKKAFNSFVCSRSSFSLMKFRQFLLISNNSGEKKQKIELTLEHLKENEALFSMDLNCDESLNRFFKQHIIHSFKNITTLKQGELIVCIKDNLWLAKFLNEFNLVMEIFYFHGKVNLRKMKLYLIQSDLPYPVLRTHINLPRSQPYGPFSSKFLYSFEISFSCFLEEWQYTKRFKLRGIEVFLEKKTGKGSAESVDLLHKVDSKYLEGVVSYFSSLVMNWNLRDIHLEITTFAFKYFHSILDIRNDLVMVKTNGWWKKAISQISQMIQFLVKVFNTPFQTCFLRIVRSCEERKIANNREFQEGLGHEKQPLLIFCLSLHRLTTSGWKQSLPTGTIFLVVSPAATMIETRKNSYCLKEFNRTNMLFNKSQLEVALSKDMMKRKRIEFSETLDH